MSAVTELVRLWTFLFSTVFGRLQQSLYHGCVIWRDFRNAIYSWWCTDDLKWTWAVSQEVKKTNENATKNDEKQILLFSFLDSCWHTGSDANNTTHVQKITRATTWIEPAIASNIDDYCGLDIHKLKTHFLAVYVAVSFLQKGPRSRTRVFSVREPRVRGVRWPSGFRPFVVFLYFVLKSRRFMSVHLWSVKICGVDFLRASLQMHAK